MPEVALADGVAPRRGIVSVVGPAVALSALAAFASTKDWLTIETGQALISTSAVSELAGGSALASSLIWVLLASWGAVLVTRGRGRRISALLGAAASLGAVLAIGQWLVTAPDTAGTTLVDAGSAGSDVGVSLWPWITLVGCIGATAMTVIALRSMASWPEMGQRYDAPRSPRTSTAPTDLTSPSDVWKAIDEGRDPTARPDA